MPPLLAPYAGPPRDPATLAMDMTMAPLLQRFMTLTPNRVPRNTPSRFTAMMRRHSSKEPSSTRLDIRDASDDRSRQLQHALIMPESTCDCWR
jgi:hypothetical protein